MAINKPQGISRLVKACGYSWQGLRFAWRNETAFQQESWALLVLLPLALWWPETGLESAVLVMSLLVVLIAELINTAVEAAINRHGDERHHWSAVAKDVASAAVLLALIQCALVWLLVLV
jgi:diacylglycerol kinase (ATP)|tara:strand:+ start:1158 stop:1517 length:360 start_codon:yes stop_codon:yes gene_type:complete